MQKLYKITLRNIKYHLHIMKLYHFYFVEDSIQKTFTFFLNISSKPQWVFLSFLFGFYFVTRDGISKILNVFTPKNI